VARRVGVSGVPVPHGVLKDGAKAHSARKQLDSVHCTPISSPSTAAGQAGSTKGCGVQFQVRRAGSIGPSIYTLEQLRQMSASGSLAPTDEVCQVGLEQWQPLQKALTLVHVPAPPPPPPPPDPFAQPDPFGQQVPPPAGAVDVPAPPPPNPFAQPDPFGEQVPHPVSTVRVTPEAAPVAPAQAGWAQPGVSGDWLMPANTVRWIFRGCLMGVVASTLLPWISIVIFTWLGITWWPGILVFIVGGAALGGTWIEQVRPWTFIGGGVCFLFAFIAMVGAGLPSIEGQSIGAAAAQMGLGWRGFGIFLCLFASAGASTFGTFAFVQHIKKAPSW